MSSALRSLATRPGFEATELLAGLIERAGFTEQQQAVSGAEPNLRIGQLVRASLPDGHDVHAGRQAGGHLGDRRARPVVGEHDLDGGGRRRRRRQPGFTSREKAKMQRMGTMMPIG